MNLVESFKYPIKRYQVEPEKRLELPTPVRKQLEQLIEEEVTQSEEELRNLMASSEYQQLKPEVRRRLRLEVLEKRGRVQTPVGEAIEAARNNFHGEVQIIYERKGLFGKGKAVGVRGMFVDPKKAEETIEYLGIRTTHDKYTGQFVQRLQRPTVKARLSAWRPALLH